MSYNLFLGRYKRTQIAAKFSLDRKLERQVAVPHPGTAVEERQVHDSNSSVFLCSGALFYPGGAVEECQGTQLKFLCTPPLFYCVV